MTNLGKTIVRAIFIALYLVAFAFIQVEAVNLWQAAWCSIVYAVLAFLICKSIEHIKD